MWQFTYTLTSLELHSPTWGSSRTVWAFPTFQRSFSELLSFTVVWRQRWDWSSQDLFRFLLQSVFHERHFVTKTEHQLLPLDTRANSFLPIPPPVLCKWLLVLCHVCVCVCVSAVSFPWCLEPNWFRKINHDFSRGTLPKVMETNPNVFTLYPVQDWNRVYCRVEKQVTSPVSVSLFFFSPLSFFVFMDFHRWLFFQFHRW